MPARPPGRRAFLAALGAAALAPRAGSAQERPKVIGYLSGGQDAQWLAKLMAERGFVVGQNLRIETRIPPDWEAATLAKAAAELVALRPDALFALLANRVGALAAATRTIPIVSGGVPDPVGAGFAKSLRRPGGNITGLSFGLPETAEIVMGLVKGMRPGLARVGGVFPTGLQAVHMGSWLMDAARKAGLEWMPVAVAGDEDLDRLLAPLAGQATFVAPLKDTEFARRIFRIATRMRVITIGLVQFGALMSYGLEHGEGQERIAAILAQVLRGANPAEIPFELPDRPRFAFNRSTARAIGLEIPPDILLRVTELVD